MKLNKVDFNKFAVLSQILASGNYQRASEALGVTPSALSQTVTGLEATLGISLFDRVGKRLIPTPKARLLDREFRRHQGALRASLDEILEREARVTGVLRIGAYFEFAKTQLGGLIRDFCVEYPDVQIKMVFDTPTRLQSLLQQRQIDLCFSIFPARGSKRLLSRAVSTEELVLIAPTEGLRDAPSFQEVMAQPMIEYYLSHQLLPKWLYLHYQKRPKNLPIRVYAATAEMVRALVAEGTGIGVVPSYLVALPAARAGLRVIRPTSKRLRDHIWLLEHSVAEQTMVHKVFTKRFHEHFHLGG